jgi:hypothetical protein
VKILLPRPRARQQLINNFAASRPDTARDTMQPTTASEAPAPSFTASVGDRCPNCEAPMSGDQRYCTECGERRGKPRLPFMDGRTRPAAAAAVAATPLRSSRFRASSSTALIAGIATLLLAMGVGVLIGNSGNEQASTSAPPVQVVSVPGVAAAPAAVDPTATTAAPTASGSASAGAGTTKGDKSTSTSKSSGAAKNTSKAKAPPVVKLGTKGTGKGFKDGKFTGDFFGP